MPESEILTQLRTFPSRLGAAMVSPRAALADIERSGRGGWSLLMMWCLAAAISLRFMYLVDAIVGFDAGGGMRIVSVLAGELTQAIPVVGGAALVIVLMAGPRRDFSLDLELGCLVGIPFLVVRAVFRAVVLLVGHEPGARVTQGSYVAAAIWLAVALSLAVRMVRQRPLSRGISDVTQRQPRANLAVGLGVLAVLGVGLFGGVRWTVDHGDRIGPLGRGMSAPDFTLARIDGTPGSINLKALRGQVVLVDFWATWCPPCKAMMPTMHELNQEFASRGVSLVGVESDGEQSSPEEVRAFLAEHGSPYPIVHDEGAVNHEYRVKVLPTMVLVGKDGNVDRVFIGMTSKSTLADAMNAALARP